MSISCGNDIVKISRIKDAILKSGDIFLNRIFTENEIEYANKKSMNKYQSYAARFAAKEATFKALSSEEMNALNWQEIEIINAPNGKPKINLHGSTKEYAGKLGIKIENIAISLSHDDDFAIALVVIEY